MSNRVYSQQNYLPVNECGVITIFPMTVDCVPIPPMSPENFGSLSLIINGGTPPYQVTVLDTTGNSILNLPPVNSRITNIPNLDPGTYFIEITDNFGDFQLLINCTIPEATTPPPDPDPLPLPPLPPYQEYSFCLTIILERPLDDSKITVKDVVSIQFRVLTFTQVNGVIIPIFISTDNNNLVYWDNSLGQGQWYLSASTSSDLTTQTFLGDQATEGWTITNQQPLPIAPSAFLPNNLPINGWNIIIPPPSSSLPIYITSSVEGLISGCRIPTLNLVINESWWQYYNSNIPSQYRGDTCGGDNETPLFTWSTSFISPLTVVSYDILCTRLGTSDVYWDVTGIDSTQNSVSSSIPWNPSPTINPINPSLGTANAEGWAGPCNITTGSITFQVTLTANLSDFSTLTSSVNFIYCQNIINNICSI